MGIRKEIKHHRDGELCYRHGFGYEFDRFLLEEITYDSDGSITRVNYG